MRKVVVSGFMSLNGVMEAPNEWHFPFWHEEMGTYKYNEVFASDAMLLGRVTYEGFAAAWPTMEGQGEFGERMNSRPRFVVSTTLERGSWNNTTIIRTEVAVRSAGSRSSPTRTS